MSSTSSTAGSISDNSWFARSKGSKTLPLRTLMLDPEVGPWSQEKLGWQSTHGLFKN